MREICRTRRERVIACFLPLLICLLSVGCRKEPEADWTLRDEVEQWNGDEEMQAAYDLTASVLQERCGTRSKPRLLGNPDLDTDRLLQGRDLYAFYCQQCHGINGDGKGPAADILRPRPRDYRKGVFKFTSTPYGYKPRKDDLLLTVKRGVSGTSMPSFALLADEDLDAIIDYVLVLTQRGELETSLLGEAEFVLEEEGDDEKETKELQNDYVQELVDTILGKWEDAEGATVYPQTPQPRFTEEQIANGYEAFLRVGCIKCHGVDGRGATEGEIRKDTWGYVTKAADITSGMLHGGATPVDIYRRIYAGINGTPMPAFATALDKEPETIWDLVAYVMYLANVRRNGGIPPAIEVPTPGDPEAVLEATMELSGDVPASTTNTASNQ